MSKQARYITTTLPYVNADPHIGFALEIVQADALARAWRAGGDKVFFTTGTDEHGQKIADKATENNQEPQAYVDHYAGEFGKLKDKLGLSYDNFIRTTDKHHIHAAQEMWKRCAANGDIYKKKYVGLYCVGDEMFVKDSDLVDGCCPNHPGTKPVEIEEENYFFALSKYQEYLEEYLSQEGVIEPEWRRKEALSFVKNGLEDFSISREKSRMSWGIPVPEDDEQVMYVWFDALTNYISTLGWPCSDELGVHEEGCKFKTFWEDGRTVQVAGKDQVRFQSVMWQAMLKSAGLPATEKVFYHGFITSDGQKMSKSIGNVISPLEMVEKYGTDAARYMLLRHVHPVDDSDVTWEKMDEWYTAHLVNGIGNLVARIMKMAVTYKVAHTGTTDELLYTEDTLDAFNFSDAMDDIWAHIQELDEFIQHEEPFKKVKDDKAAAQKDVAHLLARLQVIANSLQPFMPATSQAILDAIAQNEKPENLFPRLS